MTCKTGIVRVCSKYCLITMAMCIAAAADTEAAETEATCFCRL